MEKRDEIKQGVQAKLIEILAEQISKEADFQTLKDELFKELIKIEPEAPAGRQLNSEDGYDPINEKEAKYKKEFGFIFNPEPVKKRLEELKEQHKNMPQGYFSDIFRKSSSDSFASSAKPTLNTFKSRFEENLPKIKQVLEKMPLNDLRILGDVKQKMDSRFYEDSKELYKDLVEKSKSDDDSIKKNGRAS